MVPQPARLLDGDTQERYPQVPTIRRLPEIPRLGDGRR